MFDCPSWYLIAGYTFAVQLDVWLPFPIPYSRKLSREKTFVNFKVLLLFTKVFSTKFEGVASFGSTSDQSTKFFPIRECFLLWNTVFSWSLCIHCVQLYIHHTHNHTHHTFTTHTHHTHTYHSRAQVYLRSRFIMNGVCVQWVGWIDLETLNGKARLVYDEEQAKVSQSPSPCC